MCRKRYELLRLVAVSKRFPLEIRFLDRTDCRMSERARRLMTGAPGTCLQRFEFLGMAAGARTVVF